MFLFFWRGKTKQNNKIRMIFEPCWLYTHTHTVVINDPLSYSLTSKCQKKRFCQGRNSISNIDDGGWWLMVFLFLLLVWFKQKFRIKKMTPKLSFHSKLFTLPSFMLFMNRTEKQKKILFSHIQCLFMFDLIFFEKNFYPKKTPDFEK